MLKEQTVTSSRQITFRRRLLQIPVEAIQIIAVTMMVSVAGLSQTTPDIPALISGRLSVADGLPQATVQCLLQDSQGFLWLGTQGGLARYDGYGFHHYKHQPQDSASLSHNWINCLFEDQSGRLWIGTDGGVNILDRHTEVFTRLGGNHSPVDGAVNSILTITEDQSGVMWIGTLNNGLLRVGPDGVRNFTTNPQSEISLSHNSVSTLLEAPQGVLWIGTWGGGLNRLDTGSGIFRRYMANGRDSGPANNWIRDLVSDTEGKLWIATEKGLSLFDPESQNFRHFGQQDGLESDNIWSLLGDNRGNIWAGTLGGGLHVRGQTGKFTALIRQLPEQQQLNGDIFSIYQDLAGRIWAGTGDGLLFLDNADAKFRHYSAKPGSKQHLSHPSVWAFCEDRRGDIWVGTLNGGLNRLDRQTGTITVFQHAPDIPGSLSDNSVWAICEDQKGTLWIGTRKGLNRLDSGSDKFVRYAANSRDSNSLSHRWVVDIVEDRDGYLWIATWGGGLNRFEPGSGNFKRYRHVPGQSGSLSHNGVWKLLIDRQGRLWIGSEDGLNLFDQSRQDFQTYRMPDLPNLGEQWITAIFQDSQDRMWIGSEAGLREFNPETGNFISVAGLTEFPNDVVHGIQEDGKGDLWFSTNHGIYQFDPQQPWLKHFDALDGLQSNEFNGGASLKTRNGRLFFGGINGFNDFHPDSMSGNPFVPPVVITSLKRYNLNNQSGDLIAEPGIALRNKVTFQHDDKILHFQFAALNFRNSDKNQYAYRLEGFNDRWIQLGSQREVTFTNLDPGDYTLRVRGSNNDGLWNRRGTRLEITVEPPWWKTRWFRLIAITALAALLTLAYQRRQAVTRIRTELKAAREAQLSIMPREDPQLPSLDISGVCLPAMEVGGDFFDYLWIGPDRDVFAMAVADVSGKGMKAAMTAVMSSGMLHSKSTEMSAVNEILNHINKPIFSKTAKTMFTALLLVAIDLEKRDMTFSNAGLTEPLLKSAEETSYLQSKGMKFPLGGMQNMVYSATSRSLNPGDILVLYSDGIPEAMNMAQEFYEFDRFRDCLAKLPTEELSAKEIKEKLLADVQRFARGAAQHDDITLVVVKVR